jgi:dipeptidyl aminopeptidase/acylaminoacyl peptidase
VDCKTAVRFLRANAGKYHIDKDRVGALGFSAGGYLVSMLGVTGKSAGFEGTEYLDQSSRVQAVVNYFGPSDLCLYGTDDAAQNSTFAPLLGARYRNQPELYQKASPISYVSKESAPCLLLHGTKDWLVPIEHSRRMCKKLQEAGVLARLVEVEGESHGWNGANARKTWEDAFRFLAEHLKR